MTTTQDTSPKTIWGVDGTNRLHVLWHATHDRQRTVRQFVADVCGLYDTFKADLVAVAFDLGSSFRQRLEPTYKAGRPEADKELKKALDEAIDAVAKCSIPVLLADDFEADDCLATLAAVSMQAGHRCVLASPDKDLCQCLVAGRCTIRKSLSRSAANDHEAWFTAATLFNRIGIHPDRFTDWQCLVGDSTDGIVGCRGVGAKTASEWLAKKPLRDLIANRWSVNMTDKQWTALREFAPRLAVVRQLVTLRRDVPGVVECLDALASSGGPRA